MKAQTKKLHLCVRTQARAGCNLIPVPDPYVYDWDTCASQCAAENHAAYLPNGWAEFGQAYTNYVNGTKGCLSYWCVGQYGLHGTWDDNQF